ncbi:MAG: hypothetical protein H7835_03665 [Magnetococcus sp. XQGC-1]
MPCRTPRIFPVWLWPIGRCGRGGGSGAVLNAANEVAVAAFLTGRIAFLEIARLVEWTMEELADSGVAAVESIASVLDLDARARRIAEEWLQSK